MRTQLSRYSLGLMFCLASAVVVATGCTTSTGAGAGTGTSADTSAEEALQTEAVSAPPQASLSAKEIAEIMRQPRIDNQQLAAMFGGRAPAGAGDSCTALFQSCGADVDAAVTACGGFQGVCGSTGTQEVVPLRFLCIPNNSGVGTCTALQNGNQHTASCTVSSDGRSCSTGCNPDTCDYDKTCSVTGDQVRRCFSGGTCSNNQCNNQTFTDSVVGTCTRETEGLSCPRSELPPSVTCNAPKEPICSVSHVCACLLGAQ